MKKVSPWMSAIVGFAILVPTSAIAAPSNWVNFKKDANGQWFINKASIQREGNYRVFWSFISYSQPEQIKGKKVYSQGDYLAVDCRTKRYDVRYKRFMDQNNQLVHEIGNNTSRTPLNRPRSQAEIAGLNFVCAQRI